MIDTTDCSIPGTLEHALCERGIRPVVALLMGKVAQFDLHEPARRWPHFAAEIHAAIMETIVR